MFGRKSLDIEFSGVFFLGYRADFAFLLEEEEDVSVESHVWSLTQFNFIGFSRDEGVDKRK